MPDYPMRHPHVMFEPGNGHPLAPALRASMWDIHFIRDAYCALSARGTVLPVLAAASRVALVSAFAAIERALALGPKNELRRAWKMKGSNEERVEALRAALA